MKIAGILRHKAVQVILLLLLIGLSVFLRTFRLSVDPPYFITDSRAPFTDEGLKFYEARNLVLFGKTKPLENDLYGGHLRKSPIPVLLTCIVFRIFGVGFLQARLVSVVSSLLGLYLFYRILSRYLSPLATYVGTILLGVNFVYVSYNRMGLFETLMVFFLILTVYLWGEGIRLRIFGALAAVAAIFVKVQAAIIFPVLILSFLGEYWKRRNKRPLVLVAWYGIVVVAVSLLGYLFFTYGERLPLAREVVRAIRARLPENALDFRAISSVVASSIFLSGMPVVTLLTLCGLPGLIKRLFGAEWQRERFLFILWLLIGLCAVAFFNYRPPRYYMFLIPPVVALGTDVWERLLRREQIFGIKTWSAFLLTALWAFFICITLAIFALIQARNKYDLFYYLRAREFLDFFIIKEYFRSLREDPVVILLLSLALWFIWLGVFVLWPRLRQQENKRKASFGIRREFLAIFLLGVSLLFQYWHHRRNFLEPQNSLLRSSRFLMALTSDTPQPVVGGHWAAAFAMQTKIMVFPLNKRVNGDDTFKKFPVTHLLLEKAHPEEEIFMFDQYPEEMKRAVRMGEFKVGRWPVHLYKLEPSE
ncbi:MAG: hypothetical protein AMS15_00360 [Planctomycetes bacterium DG_23]|nr:MAG: hypothetical protein AMS15_00360 [Planctomycetes bacterium DG_23]